MKVLGIIAVSATALALTASVAVPAASAASERPVLAASAGSWERVTANGLSNTADIGLVRGHDGILHVLWVPSAGTSLLDTPIAASGSVQGAVTIVPHFVSVSFPDATVTPTGLDAFWNGEATDASSTWGTYEASRPLSGGGWHVSGPSKPVSLTWGAGMAAAAGANGKPWVAFVASGGIAVRHYGHPEQLLKVAGCCQYETGIGTDGRSGVTWVTYNSNAAASGVYARQLTQSGAPVGPAIRAPGSKLTRTLLQRMTAVSLGKGRSGVYITYLNGSPFATAVKLYRLGSKTAVTVDKLGAESPVGLSMLTADPLGRVWVAWASTINGQAALWVRRSGTDVQKFGTVEKVPLPGGTQDVWRVYLNATSSHLDIVALLTVGTKIAYWHTQVLPPK